VKKTLSENLLYQQLYLCGAGGFVALGAGYLLRSMVEISVPWLVFLLGVWPNLLGSFAMPFVVLLFVFMRLKGPAVMTSARFFGLASAITFASALIIEWAHVITGLGFWDHFDIGASVIGGLAAAAFYLVTVRGQAQQPFGKVVEPNF
jgi:hypothetical protein